MTFPTLQLGFKYVCKSTKLRKTSVSICSCGFRQICIESFYINSYNILTKMNYIYKKMEHEISNHVKVFHTQGYVVLQRLGKKELPIENDLYDKAAREVF